MCHIRISLYNSIYVIHPVLHSLLRLQSLQPSNKLPSNTRVIKKSSLIYEEAQNTFNILVHEDPFLAISIIFSLSSCTILCFPFSSGVFFFGFFADK